MCEVELFFFAEETEERCCEYGGEATLERSEGFERGEGWKRCSWGRGGERSVGGNKVGVECVAWDECGREGFGGGAEEFVT